MEGPGRKLLLSLHINRLCSTVFDSAAEGSALGIAEGPE